MRPPERLPFLHPVRRQAIVFPNLYIWECHGSGRTALRQTTGSNIDRLELRRPGVISIWGLLNAVPLKDHDGPLAWSIQDQVIEMAIALIVKGERLIVLRCEIATDFSSKLDIDVPEPRRVDVTHPILLISLKDQDSSHSRSIHDQVIEMAIALIVKGEYPVML